MYRENIFEFMQQGNKTLFIPKNGGLCEYVRDLLPKIGLEKCPEDLEVVLTRGEDIPQLVCDWNEKGKLAYGITGDDLFDEFVLATGNKSLAMLNTYDWFDTKAEYLRPALCLMSRTGSFSEIPPKPTIAINRKYELTSKRYLGSVFSSYSVKVYAGDTESKVSNGITDYCVEIVYSGKSRKENGLKVIELIRFSDISLIGVQYKNPWQREYQQILQRKLSPTQSYTSKLLKDPNEIIKKLGQELAELVQAFVKGEGLVGESLDSIYSVMVALANSGKDWSELETALQNRWVND